MSIYVLPDGCGYPAPHVAHPFEVVHPNALSLVHTVVCQGVPVSGPLGEAAKGPVQIARIAGIKVPKDITEDQPSLRSKLLGGAI